MSILFSWLARTGIEIKIRTNYDNETYNIVFIKWDYNNKRIFREINPTFGEVAEMLASPKDLISKLEFIEFSLTGTITRK